LGKAVDKTEWFTTVQQLRRITILPQMRLSFLQVFYKAPYFDNNADDALNYGGIE
jgi:putative endopeptidase